MAVSRITSPEQVNQWIDHGLTYKEQCRTHKNFSDHGLFSNYGGTSLHISLKHFSCLRH